MLSRRELLATALGIVPALGGTGLGLAAARRIGAWIDAAPGLDAPPAWPLLSQDLATILQAAPRARYWTTTALAGKDCRACHELGADLTKPHAHNAKTVTCLLCAQACVIPDGRRGRCRVRMNVGGQLVSLVYGRPMATAVDPIEKKPFYHFLPGATAFSLATSGCPLRCKFCQNWHLSQATPEDYNAEWTPPAAVAATAVSRQAPVIAFTYNEPTVFAEYLLDIAAEARKRQVHSVAVSCGVMNPAPLADMCRGLDAIKVDLKGYSETFYRDVCGAELKPVLRSIIQIARAGVHLEIVNLVVPTLNDSEPDLRALASWVAGELGPDVPLHFSRFHPEYQLRNLPPTPVATLERARDIARARGLRYVYVDNVPDHPGGHTYCPKCGKAVIERNWFFVTGLHVKNGRCAFCQQAIAGVWS